MQLQTHIHLMSHKLHVVTMRCKQYVVAEYKQYVCILLKAGTVGLVLTCHTQYHPQ